MFGWGKRGAASVLFGGQFGSEGKGLAAAWLAEHGFPIDIATTNAGAQAGHTTKFRRGESFVCYHLPTSGVIQKQALSYINAGSIIDIEALQGELRKTGVTNLRIHHNAAIITPEHKEAERAANSSVGKIASTQKGVGAAIADKIMRRGRTAGAYKELQEWVCAIELNTEILQKNKSVVVEIPQGFDLSINGLFYPNCTSRDCWVGSGLSDAGIHPSLVGEICMVVRTFPIRVGNIKNEMGEEIGNSGSFYQDSEELDWEKDFPGVEPERTTVTKRIRRIATWSDQQYERALRYNRPSTIFLNFANYLKSKGELFTLERRMCLIEAKVGIGCRHVYGFGPCVEDVTPWLDAAMDWYDKREF